MIGNCRGLLSMHIKLMTYLWTRGDLEEVGEAALRLGSLFDVSFSVSPRVVVATGCCKQSLAETSRKL